MADDQVAQLEAQLRSTLGSLFRAARGVDWQDSLSRKLRRDLKKEADRARKSRPDVPNDPWSAAGLELIGRVAEHFLLESPGKNAKAGDEAPSLSSLNHLWTSPEQCRLDIERLLRQRHDQAHPDVTPPLSSAVEAEAQAMIKRLRLGCEAIRREQARMEDEWWPFIESVQCPGIDDWSYRRGDRRPGLALINQGDTLEFVIRAVNPVGQDDELEYAVCVQPEGGSFGPPAWQADPRIEITAEPPGRQVIFMALVRSPRIAHGAGGWDDEMPFVGRVVPVAEMQ